MKRVELLQKLSRVGVKFVRHGGEHDMYVQPKTGIIIPIPRHKEIKEMTARSIIKKLEP
jgi:mRNA interferase HicA